MATTIGDTINGSYAEVGFAAFSQSAPENPMPVCFAIGTRIRVVCNGRVSGVAVETLRVGE